MISSAASPCARSRRYKTRLRTRHRGCHGPIRSPRETARLSDLVDRRSGPAGEPKARASSGSGRRRQSASWTRPAIAQTRRMRTTLRGRLRRGAVATSGCWVRAITIEYSHDPPAEARAGWDSSDPVSVVAPSPEWPLHQVKLRSTRVTTSARESMSFRRCKMKVSTLAAISATREKHAARNASVGSQNVSPNTSRSA